MIYEHNDGTTTRMSLTDYHIGEDTKEYLPLAPGNEWTYCWSNSYHEYDVIETVRIAEPGDVVKMNVEEGATSGPDWRALERDIRF